MATMLIPMTRTATTPQKIGSLGKGSGTHRRGVFVFVGGIGGGQVHYHYHHRRDTGRH